MAKVFVFGSNLAGRHGKGAALEARSHWGAIPGRGMGRQGNSYAIPTKGIRLQPLASSEVAGYVKDFLKHAAENPDDTFLVTAIGCGLAGFHPKQIGPMFLGKTPNVELPDIFKPYVE